MQKNYHEGGGGLVWTQAEKWSASHMQPGTPIPTSFRTKWSWSPLKNNKKKKPAAGSL